MKTVIAFADCGEKEGYGHLKRCSAILDAIACPSLETILLLREGSQYPYEDVSFENIPGFTKDSILAFLKARNIDKESVALIFDSFYLSNDTVFEIENEFRKTIFIDDFVRRNYSSSLVVDWTINASKYYLNRKKHSNYLLGERFVCLRSDFYNAEEYSVKKNLKKMRVLTIFGGTDPRDMTGKIHSLLCSQSEISVKHLVTSAYPFVADCRDFSEKSCIFLDLSCEKMIQAMLSADVIITAGGVSIYEIACLGVPSISINIIDNQEDDLKGMFEKGATYYIGQWDEKNINNELIDAIHQLIPYKLRFKLHSNAKDLGLKSCELVTKLRDYING